VKIDLLYVQTVLPIVDWIGDLESRAVGTLNAWLNLVNLGGIIPGIGRRDDREDISGQCYWNSRFTKLKKYPELGRGDESLKELLDAKQILI
jgi:hypothetical protein